MNITILNSFSRLGKFINHRSKYLYTACLLSLSAVSILLLVEITRRHGIGFQNDSVTYIAGARNWLQGYGISWISGGGEVVPITHYPPLYSLLLAGLRVISIPLREGARIIGIASLGINIFLVGVYANQVTSSKIISLSGVLMFLLAPGILTVHTWGLTDSLYLMFCIIAIYMMAKYLLERKIVFLITSGVAVGLGYLLRYVGISLFITLALCLILDAFFRKTKLQKNFILFSVISLAPITLWYLRNQLLTGSISTYRFIIYSGNQRDMVNGLSIMMDWYLPGRIVNFLDTYTIVMVLLISILLIFLAIFGIIMIRQHKTPGNGEALNHPYWTLPTLFFCIYIAILFGSAAFTYVPPVIDERTLAPGYLASLFVLLGFASYVWGTRNRIARVGMILVIGLLLFNKYSWTTGLATQTRFNGLGYASLAWKDSETIQAVRELNTSIIYTDNDKAMYMLTGKNSYIIPAFFHAHTADLFPNYESPDIFWERMQEENAILALVGEIAGAPGGKTNEIISEELTLLAKYHDGAIYIYTGNPPGNP